MRLFFLLLGLMLMVQCVGFAQRKVIVPEGFGTLNEIIRKDTLAGGIRKDPNTVYVLRRGAVYSLSGTILTSGYNLSLEAEPGTGPRPYVVMGFLEGGTQVDACFEVRGNASFRSIHLTAINELNTYVARVLSASSPNLRISFQDCMIDGSGQTFIRINSSGCKVYLYNTTVSRMGRPSNPDNGRVIDDRGNQIDSIVVENNTWYNVTSRIIRDGGSEIKYVKLNQNTFVNVGQRFASVGPVNQFIFTNNLIVNPRFLGNTTASNIASMEFIPFDVTPIINLNYNNIYYETEVLNAWQTIRNAGISRLEPPFVEAANQSIINSAIGILREPLTFTARPIPPTQYILQSELGNSSTIADWDWSGANSSKPWELSPFSYHNFTYPTNTQSFTGSSKGEPLGDLRWFPNYEVNSTVTDLAKQAQTLITWEQNNPVIGSNGDALAALQSAITSGVASAANPATSGTQLAQARNTLQQAMDTFRASLIITEVANSEPLIEVFPNPVRDKLTIKTADTNSSAILFTSTGQEVDRVSTADGELVFSLSELRTGLYLVRVQTKRGTYIKKIMKL